MLPNLRMVALLTPPHRPSLETFSGGGFFCC